MQLQSVLQWYNTSSFYLHRRVFYTLISAVVLFVLSYFIPVLFQMAIIVLVLAVAGVIIQSVFMYGKRQAVEATRMVKERLSNGDENKVFIEVKNHYSFKIQCLLIDELPFQFQERNWKREFELDAHAQTVIEYSIKPVLRGEYHFGAVNLYASRAPGLVIRRFTFRLHQVVKVYPSFLQMRRYQLLAATNRLQEAGVQRLRRVGHSMEFEQIKEYVRGDDYRTINWKATARRSDLMVNNFTDEKSQQIYCLINKGRSMKMPFEGMTLLDYSVNASLVLANTAIQKHDKAGIITFCENLDAFLPAGKNRGQMNQILELLYRQTTHFLEPDLEQLFSVIRNRITQRSLLVLFTNYESFESLERDLPSFKRIAQYHLLVIVFFENTELLHLSQEKAKTLEDIYIKTIADKYRHEKKLIARELQKHGILSVLTTPQKLTINTLNKYLELKNKQAI